MPAGIAATKWSFERSLLMKIALVLLLDNADVSLRKDRLRQSPCADCLTQSSENSKVH